MNVSEPIISESNILAPNIRPDCTDELTAALRQRIMVIDGAMGTAIQRDRPDEAGYRGERFKDWPSDLQGNNDLLNLTQPQIIEGIHREYLEAGADILETNTFNANAISLSDYDMAELSYELNYAGAALEVLPVDAGEDLRLGEAQQVVVALDVARPVGEPLAAVAGLVRPVALDRGAHRPVEHHDPLLEQCGELGGGIRTKGG